MDDEDLVDPVSEVELRVDDVELPVDEPVGLLCVEVLELSDLLELLDPDLLELPDPEDDPRVTVLRVVPLGSATVEPSRMTAVLSKDITSVPIVYALPLETVTVDDGPGTSKYKVSEASLENNKLAMDDERPQRGVKYYTPTQRSMMMYPKNVIETQGRREGVKLKMYAYNVTG